MASLTRLAPLAGAPLVAALLALSLAPSPAAAHGRPPFVGDLRFHPTDPDTIVARGTWGLVLTVDGGSTWSWICANVMAVDPTREDPPFAVMPDGAILVGSFLGLTRSTPERCDFAFPDEALHDVYVIDVFASPSEPETVYALETNGAGPDRVHKSTDGGLGFDVVGDPIDDILLERVRVAPSDPDRVYLSGAIPVTSVGGMRQAFVLRSSDGGETFARAEIAMTDGERNAHLLAVDPTDPDRLLVRVVRRITDTRAERLLLSEDGGLTFTTVHEARDITDASFTPDGAQVFLTSATVEGLYRSDDAGLSFTQIADGNLLCAESRAGETWICANELIDGWSLGRTVDGGEEIEPVLHFGQIYALPPCPACSEVGYVCPAWFPDLAYDLRLDGGGADVDAGMTGTPRDAAPPEECDIDASLPPRRDAGTSRVDASGMDAGVPTDGGVAGDDGCGCRAAGAGRRATTWPLLGIAALALRRRRSARG